MLFDKDEDGVLSFQEVQVVMKSMGQRPTGMFSTLINKIFEKLMQKRSCLKK